MKMSCEKHEWKSILKIGVSLLLMWMNVLLEWGKLAGCIFKKKKSEIN